MELDPQHPAAGTTSAIINEMRTAAEMLRHPSAHMTSPILEADLHVAQLYDGEPSIDDWLIDEKLTQVLGKTRTHDRDLLVPGLPIIVGSIGDVLLVRQVEETDTIEDRWMRYFMYDNRDDMVHNSIATPLSAANQPAVEQRIFELGYDQSVQPKRRKFKGLLSLIR